MFFMMLLKQLSNMKKSNNNKTNQLKEGVGEPALKGVEAFLDWEFEPPKKLHTSNMITDVCFLKLKIPFLVWHVLAPIFLNKNCSEGNLVSCASTRSQRPQIMLKVAFD